MGLKKWLKQVDTQQYKTDDDVVARKSAALHEQFEQLELDFSLFKGFFSRRRCGPTSSKYRQNSSPCSCGGIVHCVLNVSMDEANADGMHKMDAAPINIKI